MGIWDYVSSATESISGGVTRWREIVGGAAGKAREVAPDLSGALKNTRDLAKVASETAISTSQAVVERMPDREGRQKIGRLGWRIADHAIDHGTKPFTGGIPVYRFVKEELSNNKSQEKPLKEKMENTELAKLKATIQILEKKNMKFEELGQRVENLEKKNIELEELGQRMENLEKKLVEINQNSINQNGASLAPVRATVAAIADENKEVLVTQVSPAGCLSRLLTSWMGPKVPKVLYLEIGSNNSVNITQQAIYGELWSSSSAYA